MRITELIAECEARVEAHRLDMQNEIRAGIEYFGDLHLGTHKRPLHLSLILNEEHDIEDVFLNGRPLASHRDTRYLYEVYCAVKECIEDHTYQPGPAL